MKLGMYLDKTLVDAVQVDHKKIAIAGYIESIVEELKQKHQALLASNNQSLQFFIEGVPSSMNRKK
jgi:hypothetical protein